MQKKSKEIQIGKRDGFNLFYGTVSQDNPKVIYVNGKSWMITPEIEDPKELSDTLTACVRDGLKKVLNTIPTLEKRFILDFELRPDSFVTGKKKCFSFETFLVQNGGIHPISDMFNIAETVGSAISSRLNSELKDYGFKET